MLGSSLDPLAITLPVGIAVVLYAMFAAWVGHHARSATALMLVVVTLPLFVDPFDGELTLTRLVTGGTSTQSNGAIHVSVVVIVTLAGVAFLRRLGTKPQPLAGRRIIVGLMLLYTVSIIVGLTVGAGALGAAFYLQTILPLVAWYAAAVGGLDPRTASVAVLRPAVITMCLIVGAALVYSGTIYGTYNVISVLVSAIPQYRSYFPIIPACGVAFAVAGWSLHPKTSIVMIALAGVSLPLMWSRTGLVMIVVAFGLAFLLRPGRATHATRILIGSALGAVVGFYALRAVLGGVIGARVSVGSTAEASGESRIQLALGAIDRIVARPVFGDAFVPYSNVLAGGTEVDLARLFPAHNQYLDVALRGGIVAGFLVVALLFVFGRRSLRLALRSPDLHVATFHAALSAIIAAVAIGNMTHLFMVQPWSGALFFALLGVSSACPSTMVDRDDAKRAWSAPHADTPRRSRGVDRGSGGIGETDRHRVRSGHDRSRYQAVREARH